MTDSNITLLFLAASVICSTARAVCSKRIGASASDRRSFWMMQARLFVIAAVFICILNIPHMNPTHRISAGTVILGTVYGILTVFAQGFYTTALRKMQMSVCTMIYSFGFVIPTVFGTLLWHERVGGLQMVSVVLCALTIVLASAKKDEAKRNAHGAMLPLIASMLASGGLGIVQKLQQRSAVQTGDFLFVAFALASLISLGVALIMARTASPASSDCKAVRSHWADILIVGAALAAANTANTLLAGRMPSVIAFPATNVGVIIMSLLVSVCFLKERLTRRQYAAIGTGLAAVLLFGL